VEEKHGSTFLDQRLLPADCERCWRVQGIAREDLAIVGRLNL
jgi:hypothetical protein